MRMNNIRSASPHPTFTPKLLVLATACAWATTLPAQAGVPIDPVAANVPKYAIPLVIPPEMPRSAPTEPCPAGASCPSTDYNIALRQFQQQILPGGVWNSTKNPAPNFNFPATTVWSYGPATDPIPLGGVAPVPATQSSFNYPAFTIENRSQKTNTVRWINELGALDPATGKPYTLKNPQRTPLSHLLPIDRTLHWANPEKLACADPTTENALPGSTNCRPYVDPVNPDARLGLPYDGPVPMVTHVHGAEVNPYSDGFPEAWWLPSGFDKTGNALSSVYAARGNHYDQSPLFRKNSYPGSAVFSYENAQPATTLWYHDHTLGMTANNVYAGPAGFWLLRGDYKAPDGTVVKEQPVKGHLPGDSSVFLRPTNPKIPYDGKPGCDPNFDAACRAQIREIPIVIQDRSFNADGSLFYPDSRAYFDGGAPLFTVPYLPSANSDVAPIHQPEFFGNMIVVNGTVWPTFNVVPQRYRLRLLAGADARTFNLSLWAIAPGVTPPDPTLPKYIPDPLANPNAYRNYWNDFKTTPGITEIPFYQIGAEQGFLPKVVKVMTGSAMQLPGDGTDPTVICPTTTSTEDVVDMMEGRKRHGKTAAAPPPVSPPTGCVPAMATAPAAPASMMATPDRALLMSPAERADVIVDFSGIVPGSRVRMINTGPDVPFNDTWATADIANPSSTGQIMEFNVVAPTATTRRDDSTPPTKLVLSSEPANAAPSAATRQASLIEEDSKKLCVTVDPTAGLTVVQSFPTPQADLATACKAVNAAAIPFGPTETYVGTVVGGLPQRQHWADPVTHAPTKGTSEIWEIYNFTVDAHPMHLHGARIQVVNREPLTLDATSGAVVLPAVPTGAVEGPQPTETGYKDIVIAPPGAVTRIKAKFEIPGLYVWHCHIVEHEDNEMMVPICIKSASSDTACTATPGIATSGATAWPIK